MTRTPAINGNKAAPWLIAAFVLGVLVASAAVVLALRFYVDVSHPYLMGLSSLGAIGLLTWLWRIRREGRPSLTANALVFLGQTVCFAVGAIGAFYGLMSLYPPNFG